MTQTASQQQKQVAAVQRLLGPTFLLGGITAYAASFYFEIDFPVPFAAGNFLYIGASDRIPEVKGHLDWTTNALHVASFAAGIALMWAIRRPLAP